MSPREAPTTPPSVLMIGSEAVPFSKTGGLADVLGALPPALSRLGWDVTLALPRYRGTDAGTLVGRFPLTVGGFHADVGIYEAPMDDGARALLVDEPSLYDRESLYATAAGEYPDNPRRFAVLVRAAFDHIAREKRRMSVVHAHDWQGGLAAVYLKTLYANDPVLGGTPAVFTLHNLLYQGVFESDWLPRLDLPWQLMDLTRMEFWRKVSLLKGGLTDSEVITTVSPTYAREIQTPAFGCGFEGLFQYRARDVVGILNGIDTTRWDPERDPNLPAPFNASNLSGKRAAKAAMLARCGLATDAATLERPAIGMVSRMVDQKGLDLIVSLASELPDFGATFVVLGSGDAGYESFWRQMSAKWPDRIAARVGFDESLAHLIEGGADIFLMPSRFEPCGLNQMYSLRYGTVPIVRRVGGLADTVIDAAEAGPAGPAGTGFVFEEYTVDALRRTLKRALEAFHHRESWQAMQARGMTVDHSWDRSAREYVKVYDRVSTRET
jgi:starch synthase